MTLVEVLVATVLLGVGVAGLLTAATMAMRNQHRSESRLQAMCVAQEKLAEVELVGPHVYMLGRPMQGTSQVGEASYSWSVQIEQQPVGELFSVQVSAVGQGREGAQAQLATWLNDYEAKALTPADQRQNTSPSAASPPQGGGA